MSFNWLNNFQQEMEKPDDYAEKTLAAYKLGMRAKGSIVGVRIVIDTKSMAECIVRSVPIIHARHLKASA